MKLFCGWRCNQIGLSAALVSVFSVSVGCPEPPPPTRGEVKRLAPRRRASAEASAIQNERDIPFADEYDPGERGLSKERSENELCKAAYDNYVGKMSFISQVASGVNSARVHPSFLRLMRPKRAVESRESTTKKAKHLSWKRFLSLCRKWPRGLMACVSGVVERTHNCATVLARFSERVQSKKGSLADPKRQGRIRVPDNIRRATEALQNEQAKAP